jgi:hypothetical protein
MPNIFIYAFCPRTCAFRCAATLTRPITQRFSAVSAGSSGLTRTSEATPRVDYEQVEDRRRGRSRRSPDLRRCAVLIPMAHGCSHVTRARADRYKSRDPSVTVDICDDIRCRRGEAQAALATAVGTSRILRQQQPNCRSCNKPQKRSIDLKNIRLACETRWPLA